jgi:hypothetical protein
MDYHCDIYVSNFNCHCFVVLSCCICALFWRFPIRGGSRNKDYIQKKKNQYVPQLTKEHMSLYSSVNRGIYRHVVGQGGGRALIIFIDYM